MTTHPVSPVTLSGPAHAVVDSYNEYARYREEEEGKAPTALVNDYKAMRLVLTYHGLNPGVLDRAPRVPHRAADLLPSPEDVHALLARDFGDHRSYENALVRHIVAYALGIGPRAPSELFLLKVSHHDLDRHFFLLEEPKKGNPTRRLMLDPEWLCCAHNVLSVGNYIRKWRPKVANQASGDALFLKPDGRPFPSKFALAKFVKDRVRKVAPWFSFRMARRWCATARIIDSGFSYYEVSRWLGHESVEMLRNHYDQDARFHERLHARIGSTGRSMGVRGAREGVYRQNPEKRGRWYTLLARK